MRHHPPLSFLLVVVCVALAHWAVLDWAKGQAPVALKSMPDPLFGRVLQQQVIQPPKTSDIPANGHRRFAGPPPTSSMPKAAAEPLASIAPQDSGTELSPVVTLEAVPAPTPEVSADTTSADSWPPDTRVTYAVKGNYRGDFFGNAKVQWQRQGETYQVQLDIRLALFIQLTLTSQGKVTQTGLEPAIFEEVRPGRREQLTVTGVEVRFNDGQVVAKPAGVQDTASQFVELSRRFAAQPDLLKVGNEVALWLARPNGVDLWTYDIVAEDTLQTPKLGPVQAFHLKPRPLAKPRGPVMADLWFAPSLQYLPARVLITQGDSSFVDLMVEKIEQSASASPRVATLP